MPLVTEFEKAAFFFPLDDVRC